LTDECSGPALGDRLGRELVPKTGEDVGRLGGPVLGENLITGGAMMTVKALTKEKTTTIQTPT